MQEEDIELEGGGMNLIYGITVFALANAGKIIITLVLLGVALCIV